MTDDLISRQAAIDLFPNDDLYWDTNDGYIAPHFARRMIEELPSAQPTVDAVPVIRCRDCQFYQTDKGGWCLDHDDDVLWLDDSYCSRAVRREK